MRMKASLFFLGGTLVLQGVPDSFEAPPPFQFVHNRWCCEAYHYPALLSWLKENKIRNQVPRWQRLKLSLHDPREPHDYQLEALATWLEADKRGSVVIPTGAGKTFIALHAIKHVNASTLVLVPTVSLLYQWYVVLTNMFQTEIGVYYHAEKRVLPITVTTYHSAGDMIAEHGNEFRLLICDEVHHLPAKTWGEAALMTPAPYRLGLTATYPEDSEQTGERWRLDDLLGPIVYTKRMESLLGQQLADYRTQRIRINLTEKEREEYDATYAIYTSYIREQRLRSSHGPHWLQELFRLSAYDPRARQALLARQRIWEIIEGCQEKLSMLEQLLREYAQERILIFTESNTLAYNLSRQYLIPAITHETGVAERKHILESFQAGRYRALVTAKVLNEGVDLPEAKIAIILGGSSSKREYIQRLGRILRKQELKQAVLFEILARKTIEESKVQRRHVPKKDC
ncbi:DNA repair helicase [Dictyobacter vulcani]|uniref:DNA repair helicase n=2 Tax=Dictyobacter vulcani TaxID=2607529 RepID=A0A5J4KTD2_9CHLR|nr:DNA repair helicase [Dictyobacter vulcani]